MAKSNIVAWVRYRFHGSVLFASEALLFVALLTVWWKMALKVKTGGICKLSLCYKQLNRDRL